MKIRIAARGVLSERILAQKPVIREDSWLGRSVCVASSARASTTPAVKIRIAAPVCSLSALVHRTSASDPRGFLAREIIVLIDHQRADAHQRVPKGLTEPRPSDGGERV